MRIRLSALHAQIRFRKTQSVNDFLCTDRRPTGPSEDLTRANSSIAGNSSDVLHDYQESMWQIAKETGGTSFENTNNFKVGFDRVITDLDQQYVLCYAPPTHKVPGKYHQIKIVCKRPGVNLRHRQGYTD